MNFFYFLRAVSEICCDRHRFNYHRFMLTSAALFLGDPVTFATIIRFIFVLILSIETGKLNKA